LSKPSSAKESAEACGTTAASPERRFAADARAFARDANVRIAADAMARFVGGANALAKDGTWRLGSLATRRRATTGARAAVDKRPEPPNVSARRAVHIEHELIAIVSLSKRFIVPSGGAKRERETRPTERTRLFVWWWVPRGRTGGDDRRRARERRVGARMSHYLVVQRGGGSTR
tara:strand:+ start:5043 stop:5567 length:525 start_codon:yes stop_codon:yes gene_type:complete